MNDESDKKLDRAWDRGCQCVLVSAVVLNLGLTRAQLERLADSADTFKVSRRDLAYVLSQVGQFCVRHI